MIEPYRRWRMVLLCVGLVTGAATLAGLGLLTYWAIAA